tara:strand:+ start:1267 stop:1593 length:327 start_codon:yes stop_codon:yes gene_type:complete
MAYYALLDENNIVTKVVTGNDENDPRLPEEFASWEEFYKDIHGAIDCKRTSYNTHHGEHVLGGTPFRKQLAEPGGEYLPDVDAFKPVQPEDMPNSTFDTETWKWVDPE